MIRRNVFEELVGPMTIGMLLKAHRVTNAFSTDQIEKRVGHRN